MFLRINVPKVRLFQENSVILYCHTTIQCNNFFRQYHVNL